MGYFAVKIENNLLKCYKNRPFIIRKKAEYLFRFSLVVLLICLIGILLQSSLSESLFYAISLASFASIIWFLSKGNLNFAIWITVIMISIDIFCDILQFNPLSYERIVETIMESFLSYILVGFIAVNKRQIIYTISSNTVLTVIHVLLIIHFGYANSPLPSPANRYFVGGVVSVLLVGLVTLAIVRIHEEAIIIVERQNELLSFDNKQLEYLISLRTSELKTANQELEQLNQELLILAMYDQLTGIPNRRKVLNDAEQILTKCVSQGTPACITMLDIDNFKQINDTYGHLIGDLVLQTLADALKSSLQSTDIVGRIGGDEFLIIHDNTTMDTLDTLNNLKLTVKDSSIYLSNENLLQFTISIGVSELTNGESLEELIHQADIALYRSKADGRNQVSMYTDFVEL